jgi:hypothetical protein
VPETFEFGQPVVTVSESSAGARVLVLRNGGTRGESSVVWWTTDGSAMPGSDYADLGTVVLRFARGEQNRTLQIPIVGDATPEGIETFYVNMRPSDAPADAEPQRVEIVIQDDD